MLESVAVEPKTLSEYESIVGESALSEISQLVKPIKGARIVHINATAFGGGVAEILMALVPLMQDLGLEAEWQVIEGSDDFFNVTKASHNGLQGMVIPFDDSMKAIWKKYNQINAERFEGNYDYVVVHDPQPAGLLHYHGRDGGNHWIWRCHIDTSHPNKDFWSFYAPYFDQYDAGIFTMKQYAGPGVEFDPLAIIAPTIDDAARQVVTNFGIDLDRPLITQVSRFDPWKDPVGVIDAYRIVKQKVPETQLALVGSMATDDPEGWYFLDKTSRHAGEDPDIFILHNFHGVGGYEVGCFQTVSDVVIQKSTREGFGLVVTEGLWKGKPVIGGNVGGIPLQIIDGETGFLVDSIESCAEKAILLLQDPELSRRMGEAGREHVRTNYLITRHLRDYLQLFNTLAQG
jgi:trehalose synthase